MADIFNKMRTSGLKKKVSVETTITSISIIIGLIGIFLFFYKEKPHLSFEVTQESNVIDIHQPQKDLTVLFRGTDLQKTNQNIRIYTVTIRNSGRVDIKQDQFDNNYPWGLKVEDGEIIDASLKDASVVSHK